ncbi:hypothetical protein LI82_07530 [Methanococcoides methylutens]|uniref:Uncharacterized protein n=1 Tax=Methanococcoides methylutens TaxID=2226 RepID=A0A099T3A7_METMT|nr:hypothetical protein [Methanococcoides methylutens]KGK98691.1 hypothetical protein LI82_07530 [Methanococcoides methylutens]
MAIVILLLTTVTLIDTDDASESIRGVAGSTQNKMPTIEDTLMSELTEVSLDSEVRIVGISYYEDIDAVVIGLEKRTYSDNEHLRNAMINSIFEIMPVVLDHQEELNETNIVFTGSSISLTARGSRTMMKIFHTEINFDLATHIDWNNFTTNEDKDQLLLDEFEYVWWHAVVKRD